KKAYKTFDRLKSDPFNFEAMSAVTPIWMMGLDDASRILPLQPNLFDYVIIDEASQCNIAYTLPVMYRARHAIFFGDTLQMRDTTIAFKSNNQLTSLARKHTIPEDLQIKAEGDSVKSVMDIAKLVGFETTVLKKHYRSPIELIGFSNENFYTPKNRRLEVVNDDILTTEDGRVLTTHLLQTNPDVEISSKSNLTEAYYIKQLVGKIKADDRTKDKSIAVLSFFNEQAELLRRVIPDDDVKISAIEGIQGDERDIVIYSFVISSPKDKSRYIALTGESGEIRKEINEGRVNVAFSRAKLQVHAVTSLAPNLWPNGIWIKKYLQYIEEHGRVNRLTKAEQHFDSHFEEEVYDYLMQKLDINDYRISTQAESCGFKIDQVITNVKTGKKLAIECDGPTHFDDGNGQVRVESDYERQFVLETAHWTFYRISYIDWQQNRESAKKDLNDAITDHFSNREKPKITNAPLEHEEVKYEAISVEIPESILIDQKERALSVPTRSYFGRQATNKKPDEITNKKDKINPDSAMLNTLSQIGEIKRVSSPSTEEVVQISIDQLDTTINNIYGKGAQRPKARVSSLDVDSPKLSIGIAKSENSEAPQSEDIISNIKKAGIQFADKRSSGGALWIVGGQELAGFVKECKAEGISFKFKPGGGRATKDKDAWWTK
ncbi:MAG TPA: AAA domain-containing protein, partial [Patescibacteria group bacterium]|nr:AAA domain-containing protein [Patescibacteria group bacterium]